VAKNETKIEENRAWSVKMKLPVVENKIILLVDERVLLGP
jgi:hypothetical protein